MEYTRRVKETWSTSADIQRRNMDQTKNGGEGRAMMEEGTGTRALVE
jgi:hypothetical protein